MNEVKQDQAKQRDWLNAWTILVLPICFWIFFLFLVSPFPWFRAVFIAIPFICLFWATCHYFFFKSPWTLNRVGRGIQIGLNVVLSSLYLFALLFILAWTTGVPNEEFDGKGSKNSFPFGRKTDATKSMQDQDNEFFIAR